jgi:putative transposase
MARPLRIEVAGALYHITSRGDGREDIYAGEEDRKVWLEILGQVWAISEIPPSNYDRHTTII